MRERVGVRKIVLVIDDDRGIQEVLQVALEAEDYEVIVAEDGLMALEKLATVHPDLILLDLMMPRMDGYTFAKALQQSGLRSSIPLIVLTADAQAKEKAAQVGADDYVEKPFDLINLLEKMAQFVE